MRNIQILSNRQRKRKGESWFVRWSGRTSATFNSKRDAMRWAREAAKDTLIPTSVVVLLVREGWLEDAS